MVFLVDDSNTGDLTYTHTVTRRCDHTATSTVTKHPHFEDTA
jgi:hypothetical protein